MLYWNNERVALLRGDAYEELLALPDELAQCCVTSPPYFGLRDNGEEGQTGNEQSLVDYLTDLKIVFREVRRVLRKDGTLWLNLGDSYNGSGGAGGDYNKGGLREGQPKYKGRNLPGFKPKDMMGIPWRVAFTLQSDGWYLRSDIIWHKPNPYPEGGARDRAYRAHEYIFMFSKSRKYAYAPDAEYRNTVWTIPTSRYKGAHFSVFPEELPRRCIAIGSHENDTIIDPYVGSGTTCKVAQENNRNSIGVDIKAEYLDMARDRCKGW